MAPYRILIGIDFSDTSALAVERAVELALGREAAELHAVCVLDLDTAARPGRGDFGVSVDTAEQLRANVTRAIAAARGRGEGKGNAARLFAHVRLGSPVDEIVTLGAEIGADLIVLGTHGRRGLQRVWLGSVAERVVRLASCPVLVVRPRREPVLSTAYQPEPACRDCLARRADSNGQQWWCVQHDHPQEPAHHYAYSSVFDVTVDSYNKGW